AHFRGISKTLMTLCFLCAEAFCNMTICYILDGILILYGIILTVLYCRLRVRQTGTLELTTNLHYLYTAHTHSFHQLHTKQACQ
uniref:Fc receptor, IgE, high affinity I, gamma polypeptide like n=1 Tax=Lates calcarifer TaxID=8187 RepID=A0A4W6BRN8_LATCA